MRLFAAIDVPASVGQRIYYVQERLAEIPGISIVNSKMLHATLKFFGETEESPVAIARKLAIALKDFCSFRAEIVGMGVFPGPNHPRIVWVGCPALAPLQKAVLEGLGDAIEPSPHITIARVRDGRGKELLTKHVAQLKQQSYGTMEIKSIKIKSSALTQAGPIHDDVASVELGFIKPL